ncbi:hypothetical protein TGME49_311860 [Toxoplasma gondii ME49]|uniref:Uncharacterized protein n=2 Tax=Toxoplasma gondii TaxID=5811 RepID=B6K8P4_TOXGV|nr:hypothetical protein TGME49_311860 [Toxoplasma gondii ME49]EPT26055.1 hypothetical protein TGME49_311860 [Toxoplasma gondii ME49]ESS34982.1 hypothetical protein TGVEG_311860 [Toxoplasma gondii VEG]CEL77463.1 TPA: hypothetical protein BN1205_095860 [Toxoplasma gondii VEG]|eukprot:XP_002364417.1 hypothetical protein TGME49_311860 [Toxoplasma gondii ME49]
MSRPTAWPRSSFPLGAYCPATRCVQNLADSRRTAATASVYAEACSRALQAVMWKVVAVDLSCRPSRADGESVGGAVAVRREHGEKDPDSDLRASDTKAETTRSGYPEPTGLAGNAAAAPGDTLETQRVTKAWGETNTQEESCCGSSPSSEVGHAECEEAEEEPRSLREGRTADGGFGSSMKGSCIQGGEACVKFENPYRASTGTDAQRTQPFLAPGVYTAGEPWLSLGNPQQLLVPTGSLGELRRILFCPAKHESCAACSSGSVFEAIQQSPEDASATPEPPLDVAGSACSAAHVEATHGVRAGEKETGKQLFVPGDEKEWPKLTSSERASRQTDACRGNADTADAFQVLEASVAKLRQCGIPSQLLLLRFHPRMRPRKPREAPATASEESRAEGSPLSRESPESGCLTRGDVGGCMESETSRADEGEQDKQASLCVSSPASKEEGRDSAETTPLWLTLDELLLGTEAAVPEGEKVGTEREGEESERERGRRVLVSLLGQRAGTADGPERVVTFSVDRAMSRQFLSLQKSQRRAEAKKVSYWCACEADRWLALSACGTAFARVSWQATRRPRAGEETGDREGTRTPENSRCWEAENLLVKEVVLCVALVRIVDWKIAPFPLFSAGWPLLPKSSDAQNRDECGDLLTEMDRAAPRMQHNLGVKTAQDAPGTLPVPWVPVRVEEVDSESGVAASRGESLKSETEGHETLPSKCPTANPLESVSDKLPGTADFRGCPNVNLFLGAAVFPIFSLAKAGDASDGPCDPLSVILLSSPERVAQIKTNEMEEPLEAGKDPAAPTSPSPLESKGGELKTSNGAPWGVVCVESLHAHADSGTADGGKRDCCRGPRPPSAETGGWSLPSGVSASLPEADHSAVEKRGTSSAAEGDSSREPGAEASSSFQHVETEQPARSSTDEASDKGLDGEPLCASLVDSDIPGDQEEDRATCEATVEASGETLTGFGEAKRDDVAEQTGAFDVTTERETVLCVSPHGHRNDALRPPSSSSSSSNKSAFQPPDGAPAPLGVPSPFPGLARVFVPSLLSPASVSTVPSSGLTTAFSPSGAVPHIVSGHAGEAERVLAPVGHGLATGTEGWVREEPRGSESQLDSRRETSQNASEGVFSEEASDEKRRRRKKQNKKEDPGARKSKALRGRESVTDQRTAADASAEPGDPERESEPVDGRDRRISQAGVEADPQREEAQGAHAGEGKSGRTDDCALSSSLPGQPREQGPGQGGDERGGDASVRTQERETLQSVRRGDDSHSESSGVESPTPQFNLQPYPCTLGRDSPVVPVAALRQRGSLCVYPPPVVVGGSESEEEDFHFQQMYSTWQRQQLYWHQVFLQRVQGEQYHMHLRRASQIQYAAWWGRFYQHLQSNLPPSRPGSFFPLSAKEHMVPRDEAEGGERPNCGAKETSTDEAVRACQPSNGVTRNPLLGYTPPSPLPPECGLSWNAPNQVPLSTPTWQPQLLQDEPRGRGSADGSRIPADPGPCPSGDEDKDPKPADGDSAHAAGAGGSGSEEEQREDACSSREASRQEGDARDQDERRDPTPREGTEAARSRIQIEDAPVSGQSEESGGQEWIEGSSGSKRGERGERDANQSRLETPPEGVPSLPSASLSLLSSEQPVSHALSSATATVSGPSALNPGGFFAVPSPVNPFGPVTPGAPAGGPMSPFFWNGLMPHNPGTLPTDAGVFHRSPGSAFLAAAPWMYYTLPYMRNVGGLGAGPLFYPYSGPTPPQVTPGAGDPTQKGLSTLTGVGPNVPGLVTQPPAATPVFPIHSFLPQTYPLAAAGHLGFPGMQGFSPYFPGLVPGRGYPQGASGAPEAHAALGGAPGGVGAALPRPIVTSPAPGQVPPLAPAEGAAGLGQASFRPMVLRPLPYPGVVGPTTPQTWGPGGVGAPVAHPAAFVGSSGLPTAVGETSIGAQASAPRLGTDVSYDPGSSSPPSLSGPGIPNSFLQPLAPVALPRGLAPSVTPASRDERPNHLLFPVGTQVPAYAHPSVPAVPVGLPLSGAPVYSAATRALMWGVGVSPLGETSGGPPGAGTPPFTSPTMLGEAAFRVGVAGRGLGLPPPPSLPPAPRQELGFGLAGRRGDPQDLDGGVGTARDRARRLISSASSGRLRAAVELERKAKRGDELGRVETLSERGAPPSPSGSRVVDRHTRESPMLHAEGGMGATRCGTDDMLGWEVKGKAPRAGKLQVEGQKATLETVGREVAEPGAVTSPRDECKGRDGRRRAGTVHLAPSEASHPESDWDASQSVRSAGAGEVEAPARGRAWRFEASGSVGSPASFASPGRAWVEGTEGETGELKGEGFSPFARSRSSSCSLPSRGAPSESSRSRHSPSGGPSLCPETPGPGTLDIGRHPGEPSLPPSRCSCPSFPLLQASDSDTSKRELFTPTESLVVPDPLSRAPVSLAVSPRLSPRIGGRPHSGDDRRSCPCSACLSLNAAGRSNSRTKRREATHCPEEDGLQQPSAGETRAKDSRHPDRPGSSATGSSLSPRRLQNEPRASGGGPATASRQMETEDRSEWTTWSPRENGEKSRAPCYRCRCPGGVGDGSMALEACKKRASDAPFAAVCSSESAAGKGLGPQARVSRARLSPTTARLLRRGKRADLNLRAFHACSTPAANDSSEEATDDEHYGESRGRSRELEADRRRREVWRGSRPSPESDGDATNASRGRRDERERARRSASRQSGDEAGSESAVKTEGVMDGNGQSFDEKRTEAKAFEAQGNQETERVSSGDEEHGERMSDGAGLGQENGREEANGGERNRQMHKGNGDEGSESMSSGSSPCSSRTSSPERDAKEVRFSLDTLWQSFEDASVYGLEIPFLDANDNLSFVVYIPYLSALHLYPASGALDDPVLPGAHDLPLPTAAPEQEIPVSSLEGGRATASAAQGLSPSSQPRNGRPSAPSSAAGRAVWSPVLSAAGVSRSSSVSARDGIESLDRAAGRRQEAQGSERRGSASDDAKEGPPPLRIPVAARRSPAPWTPSTNSLGVEASTKKPSFKYMEVRLLYQRRPLFQQIERLLQGEEVMQSQQLNLLVAQCDELDQDLSWLCVYWQAVQRDFRMTPAPSYLVYYRLRATRDRATGLATLQRFATIPSRLDLPFYIHTSHRPLASSFADAGAPEGFRRDAAAADGDRGDTWARRRRRGDPRPAERDSGLRDASARAAAEFAEKVDKEIAKVTDWLRELRLNHPDFEHLKARGMGRSTTLMRRPGEL